LNDSEGALKIAPRWKRGRLRDCKFGAPGLKPRPPRGEYARSQDSNHPFKPIRTVETPTFSAFERPRTVGFQAGFPGLRRSWLRCQSRRIADWNSADHSWANCFVSAEVGALVHTTASKVLQRTPAAARLTQHLHFEAHARGEEGDPIITDRGTLCRSADEKLQLSTGPSFFCCGRGPKDATVHLPADFANRTAPVIHEDA
jgi:hypothetical protein